MTRRSPTGMRRLACVLTLVASLGAAAAAEPPTPSLPPAPASGAPTSSTNGDVLRATLPNGLRVVIVPDRLAPVVTTEIDYLAGSRDAPDGFPGTAHALEHMMFRGSKDLDRDQLAEVNALLGGVSNAETTETVTRYFHTAPADDLAVVLRIEAGRMRGLLLDQADWAQERGAIEQEVSRDLSNPIYTYLSQLQAILFAGTPYEHDALGSRDSFDRTDAALLRGFYDQWYAPNNAILVIAGDIDPQAAMILVQAAFGDIPRHDVPAHRSAAASPIQARTLRLPTDLPVGLVILAYRMPGLRDHDFAASDILSDVLGSERGALYAMVPAGHALASEFAYQPKADVGYGLAVGAFPKGDDPAPLLAEMREVIAHIAAEGAPPTLVEASKRLELAQLAFLGNSISGLAESWSRAMSFRGLASPHDAEAAYAAVTTADVNRLARQLLDPTQSITAILTPREVKTPTASSGFGGAEAPGAAPDKPVTLPKWASDALAELHLPDLGAPPDVSVLDNGLRLIVQPLHIGHTVSVYGRVRQVAETQEPPGKEGVASLTGKLFGYGSESLDRLAFQTALDDIAASEDAGARFELKVLTPVFEAGVKLLADNELHPAFPAEAFEVERRQTARSLGGTLQSPDHRFERAVRAALVPASDPSLRQATPDSVMALSRDDVLAYYRAAWRPDLTTIVVAGDVTPQEARRVIGAAFGDWAAPPPTPEIDLPPVPDSVASQAHVPDASALQDTVALAHSVSLPITDPSRYPLLLGNAILGDGFSSRLYRDVRTRAGYVYSIDSELSWTRTRCFYAISYGSDPRNVAPARSLVLRDIHDMQDNLVSEAELTRAKAQVLRSLPMQRASVEDLAELYLAFIELGRPLDAQVAGAKHILSATTEDVRDAMRRWLRPDDFAVIVKGPAVP